MKVITDEKQYTGPGAVLALVMFDGVHLGHRALIARAQEMARAEKADAMACTLSLFLIRRNFRKLTELQKQKETS